MELSRKEINAIATLKRLAKRWPDTLWIMSAAGTFKVMKMGPNGFPVMAGSGTYDQNFDVATVDIPNDGGDW